MRTQSAETNCLVPVDTNVEGQNVRSPNHFTVSILRELLWCLEARWTRFAIYFLKGMAKEAGEYWRGGENYWHHKTAHPLIGLSFRFSFPEDGFLIPGIRFSVSEIRVSVPEIRFSVAENRFRC